MTVFRSPERPLSPPWSLSLTELGGRDASRWVKAAGGLADAIRTGRYTPGEQLPSLHAMAAAASVHPRVMRRALLRLRELGYVVYRRGVGYYVSAAPPGSGQSGPA
jgi:DNA-binding GntR family transcriptional regulator